MESWCLIPDIEPFFRKSLEEFPLAAIDVETTGLSPETGDRVVEIAVVRGVGRWIIEEYASVIDPNRPVSFGAALVHGISPEVLGTAPPFEKIASQVFSMLAGNVILAHNIPFDLGFLISEMDILGVSLSGIWVIDTLEVARRFFSFPSNRLDALRTILGIPFPAHRALADARTAFDLFWALMGRFPEEVELGADLRARNLLTPYPLESLEDSLDSLDGGSLDPDLDRQGF